MPLNSLFKQREIGITHGSIRSKVPLGTPSGLQTVESALEKDLLVQLMFSGKVYDIISQPILDYEVDGQPRTYTPDFLVQLYPGLLNQPLHFFLEAKRIEQLDAKAATYAPKFSAARQWCRDNTRGGTVRLNWARPKGPYPAGELRSRRSPRPTLGGLRLGRDAGSIGIPDGAEG